MGASASAAIADADAATAAAAEACPEPDAVGLLIGVRSRLRSEGLSGAAALEIVALTPLLPLGVAAFAAAREPVGSAGHGGPPGRGTNYALAARFGVCQ